FHYHRTYVVTNRLRADDHDTCCLEHGGTDIHGEIHSLVHGEHAVERIDAPAVAGCAVGRVHWRNRRHELLLHLGVEQLRLEDPEGVAPVFHLSGKLVELPVELRHREIFGRDARHGTASARRLGEAEFPG